MTRIWELAKTILCFSVIFVGLGGATPPDSTATLSAWTACRKMVDTAENEPKLADFDSSKAWSAVVILRKDGRVIGVGDSHEKDPIQRAIGTAIADAKRRIGQAGGDAAAVPWSQMTLELEVGSKPEPLIGSTYLQAAQEVEPALDGIAVRRGTVWAVAHPAVLQSLNAAAAPDQTFLSLVMQLGLPARDFDEIPATERVALYKFDTTRIVQPALTMLPTFVHRGSRIEPLVGPTATVQGAHTAVNGILQWFERSLIRPNETDAAQPQGERRALQALGLRGDYLPADGNDESINAAPAEQALAAFALARCATLNASDESVAHRARSLALDILAGLQDVAEIEKDPLADPKAIAWIVMTAVELEMQGDHLKASPAAVTLSANAKGLLAKMAATTPKDALPLPRSKSASPSTAPLDHAGILRGDPLEQALTAAALASLDHAGHPLVDHVALVQSIDQCWQGNSKSQIVGILGWLLLADLKLGSVPEAHAAIARAARSALSRVQLGVDDGANSPAAAHVEPDLVGAFALSGIASKGATAQTARPGYALALMMTDPTLTPVGEQFRARAMQLGVVRFLRQLVYDEVSSYLARDPKRTLGAIRTAPWDSRVAVAGNAMALLCLEESEFAIKTLNSVLELPK